MAGDIPVPREKTLAERLRDLEVRKRELEGVTHVHAYCELCELEITAVIAQKEHVMHLVAAHCSVLHPNKGVDIKLELLALDNAPASSAASP